jgi:hypothetical protein
MALSEFPRLGFDPFVELRRMQSEMNRLFSGFTPTTRDFPPINIWLGENSGVTITSSLRSDMTAVGQSMADHHSLPRSDKRHPARLRSSHPMALFKR